MRNPLQRLRHLPWLPLSLTALATAVLTFVFEFFLALGYEYSAPLRNGLNLLFSAPFGLITTFAIALGIGALAVFWLTAVYPNLIVNSGTLWALILCLILAIFLKGLLPLPVNLIQFNEVVMVGMVVGVFWKGRPYWRRF